MSVSWAQLAVVTNRVVVYTKEPDIHSRVNGVTWL